MSCKVKTKEVVILGEVLRTVDEVLAANGKPSILYKRIKEYLVNAEGIDVSSDAANHKISKKAYDEYSKIYTKAYTEIYGDWQEGAKAAVIDLDENGEPIFEDFITELGERYNKTNFIEYYMFKAPEGIQKRLDYVDSTNYKDYDQLVLKYNIDRGLIDYELRSKYYTAYEIGQIFTKHRNTGYKSPYYELKAISADGMIVKSNTDSMLNIPAEYKEGRNFTILAVPKNVKYNPETKSFSVDPTNSMLHKMTDKLKESNKGNYEIDFFKHISVDTKDMIEVLSDYYKDSNSTYFRLLNNLSKFVEDDSKTLLTSPQFFKLNSNTEIATGMYRPFSKFITMSTHFDDDIQFKTFVHEVVHSITMNDSGINFRNIDAKYRKELQELYDYALQSNPKLKDEYGMHNLDEFMACCFNHPSFIQKLSKIPAKNPDRFNNLWEEVVGLLKRMFKVFNGMDRDSLSLYDEVLSVTFDFAEALKQDRVYTQNMLSPYGEYIFEDDFPYDDISKIENNSKLVEFNQNYKEEHSIIHSLLKYQKGQSKFPEEKIRLYLKLKQKEIKVLEDKATRKAINKRINEKLSRYKKSGKFSDKELSYKIIHAIEELNEYIESKGDKDELADVIAQLKVLSKAMIKKKAKKAKDVSDNTPLSSVINKNNITTSETTTIDDTYYQLNNNLNSQPIPELDNYLIKFLKDNFHVKTKEFDSLKERLGVNALGATDVMNKLIWYVKNRNEETVPEEVGHMIVMLMGANHPDIKELKANIKGWEEYQDVYDDYIDLYKDEEKVVIEAMGKLIAKSMVKNYKIAGVNKSLLKRILDAITKILSNPTISDAIIFHKHLADKIAINVLSGNKDYIRKITNLNPNLDYDYEVKSNPFAKSIIDTFADKNSMLTGSLAIALYGENIRRERGKGIHDLDFVVKDMDHYNNVIVPNIEKLGGIPGHFGWTKDNIITYSFLIPKKGYKIKVLSRKGGISNGFISAYELYDNKGNQVEPTQDNVMSVDFFVNTSGDSIDFKYSDTIRPASLVYGGKLSLGNNSPYFFDRDKDQEDYVLRNPKSFIPFENAIYYQLDTQSRLISDLSERLGVDARFVSDEEFDSLTNAQYAISPSRSINYNLAIVNALDKLSTPQFKKAQKKEYRIPQAERVSIRLNSKDKPNIESNIRKRLRGAGVNDTQIDYMFDYMRAHNIKKISAKELSEKISNELAFDVTINPVSETYSTKKNINRSKVEEEQKKLIQSLIRQELPKLSVFNDLFGEGKKYKSLEESIDTSAFSLYNRFLLSVFLNVSSNKNDTDTKIVRSLMDKSYDLLDTNIYTDDKYYDIEVSQQDRANAYHDYNLPEYRRDDDYDYMEFTINVPFDTIAKKHFAVSRYGGASTIAHIRANIDKKNKKFVVIEVQSDLFQETDNDKKLALDPRSETVRGNEDKYIITYTDNGNRSNNYEKTIYKSDPRAGNAVSVFNSEGKKTDTITFEDLPDKVYKVMSKKRDDMLKQLPERNTFLSLMNNNNRWQKFIINSIIQKAAKDGFEVVMFPTHDTAKRVQKHPSYEEAIESLEKDRETLLNLGGERELSSVMISLTSSTEVNNIRDFSGSSKKKLETSLYDSIKYIRPNNLDNIDINSENLFINGERLFTPFKEKETPGEYQYIEYNKESKEFRKYKTLREYEVLSRDEVIKEYNRQKELAKRYDDEIVGEFKKSELFKHQLEYINNKINFLKTGGYYKLYPLGTFYDENVTNILSKQFDTKNIKGKHGYRWNSLDITSNVVGRVNELQLAKKDGKAIAAYDNNGNVVFRKDIPVSNEIILHEFTHPFVDALVRDNPQVFNKLINDIISTPDGKVIEKYVEDNYSDRDEITKKKEVLTRAIAAVANKNIDEKTGIKLIRAIKNFLNWIYKNADRLIAKKIRDGKTLTAKDFDLYTTVNEIADIISLYEGKINVTNSKQAILSPSEPRKLSSILSDVISNNSASEQLKSLATMLNDIVSGTPADTEVRLVREDVVRGTEDENAPEGISIMKMKGLAIPATNEAPARILINDRLNNAETISTIIHEGLHMATMAELSTDSAKAKKFKNFYEKAKRNIIENGYDANMYALSSPDEFLTAVFTDSNFREILSSTEPVRKRSEILNLLYEALDLIKSIIGFKGDISLLEDSLLMSTELLQGIKEGDNVNPSRHMYPDLDAMASVTTREFNSNFTDKQKKVKEQIDKVKEIERGKIYVDSKEFIEQLGKRAGRNIKLLSKVKDGMTRYIIWDEKQQKEVIVQNRPSDFGQLLFAKSKNFDKVRANKDNNDMSSVRRRGMGTTLHFIMEQLIAELDSQNSNMELLKPDFGNMGTWEDFYKLNKNDFIRKVLQSGKASDIFNIVYNTRSNGTYKHTIDHDDLIDPTDDAPTLSNEDRTFSVDEKDLEQLMRLAFKTYFNVYETQASMSWNSKGPIGRPLVMTEAPVYSDKKDIKGTIDLLVVYDNGKVGHFDWKFMGLKDAMKKQKYVSQDELQKQKITGYNPDRWGYTYVRRTVMDKLYVKRDTFEQQVATYKDILNTEFKINKGDIVQSRVIPVNMMFAEKPTGETYQFTNDQGKVITVKKKEETNALQFIDHDYELLQSISLAKELTGDVLLDRFLTNLYKERDKLNARLKVQRGNENIRNSLRDVEDAIDSIVVKKNIAHVAEKVYNIANVISNNLSKPRYIDIRTGEGTKTIENPEYINDEDLNYFQNILIMYSDLMMSSENKIRQLTELSEMTEDADKKQQYLDESEELKEALSNQYRVTTNVLKEINEERDRRLLRITEEGMYTGNSNSYIITVDKNTMINSGIGLTDRVAKYSDTNVFYRYYTALSEISHPHLKLYKDLMDNLNYSVKEYVDNTSSKIEKGINGLKEWAKRNNKSMSEVYDLLVMYNEDKDDYMLLKPFTKELIQDTISAREDKNIEWLKKHMEFDKKKFNQARENYKKSYTKIYANKKDVDEKMQEFDEAYNPESSDYAYYNKNNRYLKYNEYALKQYKSSDYEYIMKQKELREFYNMYKDVMSDISNNLLTSGTYVDEYFIPNVRKDFIDKVVQDGVFKLDGLNGIKELIQRANDIRENDSEYGYQSNTEEVIDIIPLQFKDRIPGDLSLKSKDLGKSLLMFAYSSKMHQLSKDIEGISVGLKMSLATTKLMKKDMYGNIVMGSEVDADENTNLYKMLDGYINKYIYGRNLQELGEILGSKERTKWLMDLMSYQSKVSLAFNHLSLLGGHINAESQILTEAARGRHFTKKIWAESQKEVIKSSTKSVLAYEFFEVSAEGNSGLIYEKANKLSLSKLRSKYNKSLAYAGQRKSDDMIDKVYVTSMMKNYILHPNGKTIFPKQEAKLFTKGTEYEGREDELKTMWETMQVDESSDVEGLPMKIMRGDGKEEITKEQYIKFRNRIRSLASKAKGNYNSEDSYLYGTNLALRALMQYRGWIPAYVKERVGAAQYSSTTDDIEVGRYRVFLGNLIGEGLIPSIKKLMKLLPLYLGDLVTFNKFNLAQPSEDYLIKSFNTWANNNPGQYEELLNNFKDFDDPEAMAREKWKEAMQGQIKKTMVEVRNYLAMSAAALSIGFGVGEDELDDRPFVRELVNVINRAKMEIGFFFMPTEMLKLVQRSPLPVFSVLSDVVKLAGNSVEETKDFILGAEHNKTIDIFNISDKGMHLDFFEESSDRSPMFNYTFRAIPGVRGISQFLEFFESKDDDKTTIYEYLFGDDNTIYTR